MAAHCGAPAAGLASTAVGLPVLPAHGLLGGGGGAGAGTRALPGTGRGYTRAPGLLNSLANLVQLIANGWFHLIMRLVVGKLCLASVPESVAVRTTDRMPFRRTDAAASPTRPTF